MFLGKAGPPASLWLLGRPCIGNVLRFPACVSDSMKEKTAWAVAFLCFHSSQYWRLTEALLTVITVVLLLYLSWLTKGFSIAISFHNMLAFLSPYQQLSVEIHLEKHMVINGIMCPHAACFFPAQCTHSHAKQMQWRSSLVFTPCT